jgi:hypothetical protein
MSRLALAFALALIALPGCKTLQQAADDVGDSANALIGSDQELSEAKSIPDEPEPAPAITQPVTAAPAQTAPAPAAPTVTMPTMPSMPSIRARRDERIRRRAGTNNATTQNTSSAYCCVNRAFYSCSSAANAAQCLGEPMQLMQCMQSCGMDANCEPNCIKKHGPDPSPCSREMGRDSECKR